MKFKYTRCPCQPSEVFPKRHSTLRPIANIVIKHQDRRLRLLALLDTGSDWCLFPASVGEYLGLQIEQGKQLEFKGISASAKAYFHEVTLEIGGWGHNCLVGFSYDMDKMNVPSVLGQDGFFDRYEVIFNHRKEIVEVKKVN